MAEPLDYQIVLNLQTALLAISVASGYHYDMPPGAVKLDPDHDVEALIAPTGPRPFMVFDFPDEDWKYQPSMRVELVLPIRLLWVHESDPTVDNSMQHVYRKGLADVERALAPLLPNGPLQGLATDLRIVNRQRDLGHGAQVWALIDVDIKLYRTYGQPNG